MTESNRASVGVFDCVTVDKLGPALKDLSQALPPDPYHIVDLKGFVRRRGTDIEVLKEEIDMRLAEVKGFQDRKQYSQLRAVTQEIEELDNKLRKCEEQQEKEESILRAYEVSIFNSHMSWKPELEKISAMVKDGIDVVNRMLARTDQMTVPRLQEQKFDDF